MSGKRSVGGGEKGISRRQHRCLARVLTAVTRPFWHLTVQGLEHIPPRGGFILLPKHRRWEDIPMVGLSVPRRLTFIAKTELFTNSINRAVLGFFGGLPLNRQRPLESRATLSRAAQLLVAERGVVVFPEGTYYPDRVGPGHKGIVRFLMRRTTAPFVPMGIRYSKSLPTRGLRVHIRIGSALYPDGDKAAADDFVNRIMKHVAVLSGLPG